MPSPVNSPVFPFQGTQGLHMGVSISQNGDITQRKWVALAKSSKDGHFLALVWFGSVCLRGSLVAKPCLKLQDYLELLILHVSEIFHVFGLWTQAHAFKWLCFLK